MHYDPSVVTEFPVAFCAAGLQFSYTATGVSGVLEAGHTYTVQVNYPHNFFDAASFEGLLFNAENGIYDGLTILA